MLYLRHPHQSLDSVPWASLNLLFFDSAYFLNWLSKLLLITLFLNTKLSIESMSTSNNYFMAEVALCITCCLMCWRMSVSVFDLWCVQSDGYNSGTVLVGFRTDMRGNNRCSNVFDICQMSTRHDRMTLVPGGWVRPPHLSGSLISCSCLFKSTSSY